jgi:hypothetical protein
MTNETIENALRSAPSFNIGAKPVLVAGSPLHKVMLAEKLIGKSGGLTRKGSIRAERLKRAQELALFGI